MVQVLGSGVCVLHVHSGNTFRVVSLVILFMSLLLMVVKPHVELAWDMFGLCGWDMFGLSGWCRRVQFGHRVLLIAGMGASLTRDGVSFSVSFCLFFAWCRCLEHVQHTTLVPPPPRFMPIISSAARFASDCGRLVGGEVPLQKCVFLSVSKAVCWDTTHRVISTVGHRSAVTLDVRAVRERSGRECASILC